MRIEPSTGSTNRNNDVARVVCVGSASAHYPRSNTEKPLPFRSQSGRRLGGEAQSPGPSPEHRDEIPANSLPMRSPATAEKETPWSTGGSAGS